MFISNAKKVGLFFILTVLLAGCKKKKDDVPDTYVNVTIYTTEPSFANLNAVGGWIYVNAGYKGIIVYRKSQEDFIALERACTFDPQSECDGITVTTDNITAQDTCCGSKFLIFDGSITQGPATAVLSQYRTSYDGTTLKIFN